MQIKTNNTPRLLLSWYELTEKEKQEFDYLTDDTPEEDICNEFFRYKGNVYDLSEFMRIDQTIAPHCQREGWEAWHGYSSDSFFSGILVRYTEDCDRVIVGRYYC